MCPEAPKNAQIAVPVTPAGSCGLCDQSKASVNSGFFQVVDFPKIPELPNQVAEVR